MGKLSLNQSESVRDNIAAARQREISSMYDDLANEVMRRADALNLSDTTSSSLQASRLRSLASQLMAAHDDLNDDLEDDIEDDMEETATAVVNDNRDFLSQVDNRSRLGSHHNAFSHVPKQAVSSVINGDLYGKLPDGSSWTLSKAIWHDNMQFNSDINKIIAEGMAANKSSLEIAKALEKYVKGDAKKDFDWSKVYPGTRKVVDYNAQRLARTMISHAYQQTLVRTSAKNPFISGFIWHVANSHRVCPICADMDGNFYHKNVLPLDHPNGMCYWECVIPDMDDVAERIAYWSNGEKSTVLPFISDHELNVFAQFLKKAA